MIPTVHGIDNISTNRPSDSSSFVPVSFSTSNDPDFNPNRNIIGSTLGASRARKRIIEPLNTNPKVNEHLHNRIAEDVQNSHNFPSRDGDHPHGHGRWDYSIDINATNKPLLNNVRTNLNNMREMMGIQVHGSNIIAQTMKLYTYNRFRVPDTNMAHSKSFTHIFFTRPDCNVLIGSGSGVTAHPQIKNNTEGMGLWNTNPVLFKFLTDRRRSGDASNLILLLSNQVDGISLTSNTLKTIKTTQTWNNYYMSYGTIYEGRTPGTLSLSFTELRDYSVTNLIKMWMTYIHNISSGAWRTSYNLSENGNSEGVGTAINNSHVYTKTIDYASSIYVFKVAEDGETILYWAKYYGVFPISSGESSMSVNFNDSPGNSPKVPIEFQYAFKREMSPVALVEFNRLSSSSYDSANFFDRRVGSAVPFVGAPFVGMRQADPKLEANRSAGFLGTYKLFYRQLSNDIRSRVFHN